MAKFDVKTNVSAPSEITIPLIRADHASTSNVFRIFFEIFLSIFSTLLGYILSVSDRQFIHWIFLAIFGLAALAFLVLSIRYGKDST